MVRVPVFAHWVFFIAACTVVQPTVVLAQTERLDAIVRDNYCSANMREYETLTYREHCQQPSPGLSNQQNMEIWRCQARIDRINSSIYRYNAHVRSCQRHFRR